MNGKVFGTANDNPLWEIYNCRTSIKGEIYIKGKLHTFGYEYQQKSKDIITGNFGPLKMSMGNFKKTESGFIYEMVVEKKKHFFTIQYDKIQSGHMINPFIQGTIYKDRKIKLKTDGPLCPFDTFGVIMISVGSPYMAGN